MSDLLQTVVVASPFANMTGLYEVDPDADVVLTIPAFDGASFAPAYKTLETPNGSVNGINNKPTAASVSHPGLRIKVSSKHLSFASRAFKSKLQVGGSRKTITQSDGRVHISVAAGFDPRAVTTVMNAIHGRGSKVPRAVDLETLAKIALFVDKFQLFDALEVYADRWISNLLKDHLDAMASESSQRDLVFWIFVSYVFRRPEVFKSATKAVAINTSGPIQNSGLPIREKIIKHIDLQRQELVSRALDILHSTLDNLRDGKAACDKYYCDSFLLGELIKTLHNNSSQPVWPRPSKPFTGVGFAAIVKSVYVTSIQLDRVRGGGPSKTANGATVAPNRKRKSPVQAPITPDSSPEPVLRTNGITFENHECNARKLVLNLNAIEALEVSVVGLDLLNDRGYQQY
ncbi:hypothetical protein B0H66DRAFT_14848 [Apodospora peruviana]|uniref:BTB domain-containing protein n=1 Tax=Apodospora peruviana TaxID=516989 RepID=A0AAE0IQ75_9PEZI|nr:hypothetical protein B0H66DRAFT_14848 [Apodospora peruviana]